jgi:hypothetical protein
LTTAPAALRELGARVLADTPVRSGFVEAMAGISSTVGAFADVTAAVRPADRLALGAQARWTAAESYAGAFARWTF